jgi:hypothetical protein
VFLYEQGCLGGDAFLSILIDVLLLIACSNAGPNFARQAPAPGSRDIQWERSFYLNLALHSYTYNLSIVIGRRPPGGQLEILSKVRDTCQMS